MNIDMVITMIENFLKNKLDLTISYVGEEINFEFTAWVDGIYQEENVIVFSSSDGNFESEFQIENNLIDDIKIISDEAEDCSLLRIFFKNGNELSLF